MAESSIERLIKAVGYPMRVPDGALSFTLLVDGMEIVAEEAGGRLRLKCRLTSDESSLPRLAGYAAGRILREDAVLSCDREGAFLWREVAPGAGAATLQGEFEAFADSCDWWRERLEQRPGGDEPSPFPEMTIRP